MQPIEVSINGESVQVPLHSTVESALMTTGYTLQYAAVAINESILPRTQYRARVLQPGDRLEVLMPFAGG